MARTLRYVHDKPGRLTPYPESRGMLPFGAFAVSPRIQKLTLRIAKDVKAVAKAISPEGPERGPDSGPAYKDSFIVVPGEPLKIDGLERATALVGNTSDHAAAIEFGSGEVGDIVGGGGSTGEGRPQGGGNSPKRVLARAGSRIGEFHGG
jgi:hypothetical protein